MFGKELMVTSIFGTNVVENFFGKVRQKLQYLNYWEFAIVENRAWMELVKYFASDRPFPLKQIDLHATKCYNNQKGLKFTMAAIPLIWNKQSAVHKKRQYRNKRTTEEVFGTSIKISMFKKETFNSRSLILRKLV